MRRLGLPLLFVCALLGAFAAGLHIFPRAASAQGLAGAGGGLTRDSITNSDQTLDDLTVTTLTVTGTTSPFGVPTNGEICLDTRDTCSKKITYDGTNIVVTGGFSFANSGAMAGNLTMSGNDINMGTASDLNFTGVSGRVAWGPQTQTVADDGAGTAAAATLTPTSNFIAVTCNDANGCDETVSESGALHGSITCVVNVSANAVNFADSAGVTELAGAFAAGQWDQICFVYVTDRWVETSRSNN